MAACHWPSLSQVSRRTAEKQELEREEVRARRSRVTGTLGCTLWGKLTVCTGHWQKDEGQRNVCPSSVLGPQPCTSGHREWAHGWREISILFFPCWSRGRVWGASVEGAPWTMCDELTLCTTGGKQVSNSGAKLSLGRRQRWRKSVFKISRYSTLIWFIINKIDINNFPQVKSVLLLMLTNDKSLPVFILTHEIYIFYPLSSWAGEW